MKNMEALSAAAYFLGITSSPYPASPKWQENTERTIFESNALTIKRFWLILNSP